MVEYAESRHCRWQAILDDFGHEAEAFDEDRCGHCDRCGGACRVDGA